MFPPETGMLTPRDETPQGRRVPPRLPLTLVLVLLVLLSNWGCGKKGSQEAASVPTRSGEVWEVDSSAGRAAMPGATLAYVNGLHVMVIDGDEVYAGMTRLKAQRRSGGARALKLSNGLEAEIVPAGEQRAELRFSSGEAVALRRR